MEVIRMADFVQCPGLEASTGVIPEVFTCPVCKGEVEIWSDEKRARCPVCHKLLDKHVLKTCVRHPDKKYHVEVKEYRDGQDRDFYFEQYETIIPISSIEYSDRNKAACEACRKYGKNFACPPFSPGLREFLTTQRHAKIIAVRMPQEYFRQVIQENIYWDSCEKAEALLKEELLRYREKGHLIAGAGACSSCEVCGAEQGLDRCQKQDDRIFSLESMGVNIAALVKRSFDFDLAWSEKGQITNFVCSTGAVFCNNKKI
jgi:predicted metal-binding protein